MLVVACFALLALIAHPLQGGSGVVFIATFEEPPTAAPKVLSQPEQESEPEREPQLSIVLQAHIEYLIERYCREARRAQTFTSPPFGDLGELRERIILDPRLDLVITSVGTLDACRPKPDDTVHAKYYICRLLTAAIDSAHRRAEELAAEHGGRSVPMRTAVPGNGSYMPGCDPEIVEDLVQRAAYILRKEENAHISRLGQRASSVPHTLRNKQLEIRRIIRAHVSASSDADREFLIDLLDIGEIMSITDIDDMLERRRREAPPQP